MHVLITALVLLFSISSFAQQKTLMGKWEFLRLKIDRDTLFNKQDTFTYYRNYKAKEERKMHPGNACVVFSEKLRPIPDSSWFRKVYNNYCSYYIEILPDNRLNWVFPMHVENSGMHGYYTMDRNSKILKFYSDSLRKKLEAQFYVNMENATLQLTTVSGVEMNFWFNRSK